MKNKKIILWFCILVTIQLTFVSAISVDITMGESFEAGEEISFDYTISSSVASEIEYMVAVNCPSAPLALLNIKTASLEPGIALEGTYVYMSKVSERIEPQTCTAGVNIISPEEILEQKDFSIIVDSSFDFNILTCKDIGCREKASVFVLNDEIYFDFDSMIEGVAVTGELIYPNEQTEQLVLPTTINAEQIGTYSLEVVVSKGGYKTIEKTIEFGVIKREVEIGYAIEDGGIGQLVNFIKDNWVYFLIGGVTFFVIFILFRVFMNIKRRNMNKAI
jgi:hypothetical protein